MYLLAGALTILWAFVIPIFMPPDPIRARGLNDRERYIAVARMRINNTGVRNTHFKKEQVYELLTDLKFWLCFLMAVTMFVANEPVSRFEPIIINDLGFSGLNSLLLIMPAGFVIGTVEWFVPYLAMRYKGIRSYLVAGTVSVTILAVLLLWLLPQSAAGAKLFAVYILAFFGGGYAMLMGLVIGNNAGYTKRSVVSSGMFVGYCLGNFMGPLVFLERQKPYYTIGWIVTIVTSAMCLILALVCRYVCWRDNRRRDASGVAEGFEHAYEDDLTDRKNPQFRYTL